MQVAKQELTVSNSGQAAAHVTWSCAHPAIALVPSHATVAAGSEQQFDVIVTGREIGRMQAELVCSVEHGAAQAIEVTAAVAGISVQVVLRYTQAAQDHLAACGSGALVVRGRNCTSCDTRLFSQQAYCLRISRRYIA